MKYLFLLLIAFPTLVFSQTKVEQERKINPLPLYTNPEFVGGPKALKKYIDDNFRINRTDRKRNTKGEIIVKFYIGIDGSISKATIINKGLSDKLNKEALRVISEMPKWKPATQSGKVVKIMYAYTISVN